MPPKSVSPLGELPSPSLLMDKADHRLAMSTGSSFESQEWRVMEWEIRPFEGMGPIKFGMTKSDVAAVLGEVQRTRRGLRPNTFSEYRSADTPIIKYIDDQVTEIEAFYGVNNVKIREFPFLIREEFQCYVPWKD